MREPRALKSATAGLWRALRAGGCALVLTLGACTHASESAPRHQDRVTVIAVSAPTGTASVRNGLRPTVDLTCEALAPNGCDLRDESCQERLFDLTRCLAARDGVRPPLRFISEAESRRKLREHRAQTSDALAGLEQGLAVLGLGRAAATAGLSDEQRGVGPNAYYAPRERAVFFVAADAVPYDGELGALSLVHEYVHAIQDRHGELLRARSSRDARSFDQELTLWSAFEGEAALYEEVVRAFLHHRDPRTWVVERFISRTGGSDDAIVRQGRPLEASLATFPYSYGAYWAALETARPLSTQELLATRHEWPLPDAEPCLDETPTRITPDSPRGVRETLGAWLVQAYVRKVSGNPERARSAARQWRGDWLSLYTPPSGGPPSVVWQTCWDSAQTASEMRELVATQLGASTRNRASVTNDARHVTATVWAEDLSGPDE